MKRHQARCGPRSLDVVLICCGGLIASPVLGDWVTYTNESAGRLSSIASVGLQDEAEKDYAVGDLDHPMSNPVDLDLVVVRKEPFMTSGGRRNVLFMNVNGVLTDQTASYIPAFLDLTNDRDVVLADINNDDWLDIVTATACLGCDTSSTVDDARVFLNLGRDGDGDWLGFGSPIVLNGLFTGPGPEHNFCAVAAGDLDGDLNADLYFASYDDDGEDQLLMGDGSGGFTNGNNRLTADMRESVFATAVVFADMDNDNDLDIVKSKAGAVQMFRNNGNGVFDLLDPTYGGSAYHVGVGNLNGDGLLDLIISDDGIDRYIINDGNLLDGSPDIPLMFPDSTDGFGSNSYVTDLDGDGWHEVLVTDVDVQVPGCTKVADILRNDAGTFTSDIANIPASELVGVHDIAVFDVDGDTLDDLVIGRCGSTQVWIRSLPVAITFSYPHGLPEFVPPETSSTLVVQMDPIGDTIEPGTETLFYSINDGPYLETSLVSQGGGLYEASMPATGCLNRVSFYFSAGMTGGLFFTDPSSAPASTYQAVSADGVTLLLEDNIEGDVSGWTVTNDPSLTSGAWEQADPNATVFNGMVAAPGDDTTPGGTQAWVTQNGPPGAPAAAADVDEGPTVLTTPILDLDGIEGFISYSVWAFSSIGAHDFLTVEISNDAGGNWALVESVGDTGSTWENHIFFISDLVAPTDQVQLRFSICDCPNDSVTEAGIDDLRIDSLTCSICPWDLNGNGFVDIVDFLDLLAAWGTDPGGPPDFDGNGDVGITDFLDLLANWGPCE